MTSTVNETPQKPAYSVAEVAIMTSLSKAFLRNEIRAKHLKAKSFGRRVLILDADLQAYLNSKNDWTPTNQNGNAENN